MELAYFHWFLLLTKAATLSGNREHSTNPCIAFDRQQGHHILLFANVNILLQALDLYSFEKYIYRLYHQWLASFWLPNIGHITAAFHSRKLCGKARALIPDKRVDPRA